MSLDFYLISLSENKEELAWHNITHNLIPMAEESWLYQCLWRPTENNMFYARDIIMHLKAWIYKLQSDPEKYKKLNSDNWWWSYHNFLPFVKRVLESCEKNPEAEIESFV